jgi:hypothetical protein
MCCTPLRPVPVALRPAATFFSSTPLTTSSAPPPAPVRLRAGMRRGGATGAPPAGRSRHHDRSQPAPPPPMLAPRGFRGSLLPTFTPIRCAPDGATSATPPVAVWLTRWTTPLVVLAPSGQRQPLRPWRSGQSPRRPRCAGRQPRASRSRPHRTRPDPRPPQPLHRPVLRNGRWRGMRLTLRNWTSTTLRDHDRLP